MTTTRFFFLASILTTVFPAIASAQLEIAVEEPYAPPPPSVVVQPQPVQVPVVVVPAAEAQPIEQADPEDIDGTFTFAGWIEMMSLDELSLRMDNPEVAALAGMDLSGWQGLEALRDPIVGGAMVSAGMRMDGWLRGPELRLMIGGTDTEDVWVRAPGSDLELAIQDAVVFRVELALGVQAPLGAFRPYIQARLSVGGAWADVAVRDARLGQIGVETVADVLAEAGLEAGAAFAITDELELGFAARASVNQYGGESIGGIMQITVLPDGSAN